MIRDFVRRAALLCGALLLLAQPPALAHEDGEIVDPRVESILLYLAEGLGLLAAEVDALRQAVAQHDRYVLLSTRLFAQILVGIEDGVIVIEDVATREAVLGALEGLLGGLDYGGVPVD